MKRPSPKLMKEAVRLASYYWDINEWRLVEVNPGALLRDSESPQRHDVSDLVKIWKKAPQTIPPIVVTAVPGGDYKIVDGHHRHIAALAAKMKKIYVIEVR